MTSCIFIIGMFAISLGTASPPKPACIPTLQNYSQENNFFHNLTELIDKALIKEPSSETESLQKSLEWSPLVLYSTDLSLNKLTELLVKVVNLLNQFSAKHQVMLSLRFTDGSRFKWSRIKDLYYDLTQNISESDRTLITTHLSSVLLDWQVDNCQWDQWSSNSCQDTFYSRVDNNSNIVYLEQPSQSFLKRVKNFLELVTGNANIPVGMLYTQSQINCHTFLRQQALDSDFRVVSLNYKIPSNANLLPEQFHQQLKIVLYRQKLFLGETKNTSILVHVNANFSSNAKHFWDNNRWHSSKLQVMKYLPNIQNVTEEFLNRLYAKEYIVLSKLILSLPQEIQTNVIFGEMPGNIPTLNEINAESRNIQKLYVVPSLNTSEESHDIYTLGEVVTEYKLEHEGAVFNFDGWRSLAKNQAKLAHPLKYCQDENQKSYVATNKTNVILYFDAKTAYFWNDIEDSIVQMLQKFKQVYEMTLKTILFRAESIKQNNFTIAKFLQGSYFNSSKYEIGCIIDFESAFRHHYFSSTGIFSNGIGEQYFSTETNNISKNASEVFKSVFVSLCEPIFDRITTMVWTTNDLTSGWANDEFYKKEMYSLPRYSNDVFLTRKLFLQEFPDKQVIIQPKEKNNDVSKTLAKLYEAPIMLPVQSV